MLNYFKMNNYICIIPAREGSKRIKNKNIKSFFGKPIIFYSIKTSINSKIFKEVHVSTDSSKIQRISKKYGAKCDNLRKKKLADDKTKTFQVIKDFYNEFKKPPEIVCCLYPASPFIKINHLKKAFNLLKKNKNLDLVIPVSEFSNNPQRSLIINNKFIKPEKLRYFNSNSNNLKKKYYDTGSFYMLRGRFIKNSKSFFPSRAHPMIIKKNNFIDLNDKDDWSLAIKLFK